MDGHPRPAHIIDQRPAVLLLPYRSIHPSIYLSVLQFLDDEIIEVITQTS